MFEPVDNRFLFKPEGRVLRTPRRWDLWWLLAVPTLVMLGAYAYVSIKAAREGLFPKPHVEAGLIEPDQADAYDAGHERGRRVERSLLVPQLRKAYERGLNDAARAIAEQQPGVAMKQACMALDVAAQAETTGGKP